MQGIGDILKKKEEQKKTNGGVNSPFNHAVAQLVAFMGEDKKRFGYWCGRLRKLDPSTIYQLMSQAKEGKNPQALFNYLLKKWNEKQKTNITSSPKSATAAGKRKPTSSQSTGEPRS